MGDNIRVVATEYGDWEGLYINGELVYENHSISIYDGLILLKEHGIIEDIGKAYLSEKNMEEFGGELPNSFEEI